MRRHNRRPVKLKLGVDYMVGWEYNKQEKCRFIKPTRCGFNFLNLSTNECILKQHLYKSKTENHNKDNWFWVNENLNLSKVQ